MSVRTLSHRERLETTLAGARPDRTPVALWRHFPVDDQQPSLLAGAVVAFQEQFDFDLVKVTPSSSFCLYDWGATDTWRGNPEGTREYGRPVIQHPEDWARLPVLDPLTGWLGRQVDCISLIRLNVHKATPVLQTIFNPLSQAKNLVGKENLIAHIRQYPELVHRGLETITQSTLRFLEVITDAGNIDGIFFAVQHAQHALLTESEYSIFGRAYDLRILKAAQGLWLNMLHLHGENVMFDLLADYPVQMINWHDRQTPPDLRGGQAAFPGTVVGGLRQWDTMVLGTPEQVHDEAADAIRATNGLRFVLGTGCVLPITAPYGNIMAARNIVRSLA